MKYFILVLGLILSFGGNQSGSSCKTAPRSEVKMLACVVYYEARGASEIDKIATAYVALNRVDHPNFSNKLSKVVYKPHQFTWTKYSHSNLTPKNRAAWEDSKRIASLVLNDEVPDPTKGQVYFSKYRMKYMKKVTLKTGAHYYGK